MAAEIKRAHNRRTLFVPVDVADEDSIDAMAATVVEHCGGIDSVLASAGISSAKYGCRQAEEAGAKSSSGRRLHVQLPDWQRVLGVNLAAVMLTNRICARHMVEQGMKGTIVKEGWPSSLNRGSCCPQRNSPNGVDRALSAPPIWLCLAATLIGTITTAAYFVSLT